VDGVDLVLFDWAVLTTSRAPFLVHDTLLFKNIENQAVANTISVYSDLQKQTFIAIDEVQKYGDEARDTAEKHAVLRLSQDQLLYWKNWRKEG
jgi:hypothetical protein